MALGIGREMFIKLNDCTITAPLDCEIPVDRFNRVPAARLEWEKPTAMTERIIRWQFSQRFAEIRELELEGPIPRNPDKVRELHEFGVNFRKHLPSYFQTPYPDTKWDEECPFLIHHRAMLAYMVDSFFMALHRPYVFTRERSQHQVYTSSLNILVDQEQLYEVVRDSEVRHFISLTFPTFDAAVSQPR
jgi:hypothetical protein